MSIDPMAKMTASGTPVRHVLNGPTMGARWSATFVATQPLDLPALTRALQAAVEAVEQAMSTWRATSDLCRLNAAPVGEWVALPPDLLTVLAAALEIGRQSGGAFDIGVGDLVTAWGFGGGARAPDIKAIDRIAGRASFEPPKTLQLDPVGLRARKFSAMKIDVSGIAKGYGVDQLAEVMATFGVASFLVGIDGEMRAAGTRPDGRPWCVGHEKPSRAARDLLGVLELADAAVATSGNYRHVAEVDGRALSHTMDPATGAPLDNDLASVTVLAPTAMQADGWATALLVLGRDAGRATARRLGLGAILVGSDGTVTTTWDADDGAPARRA